MGSSFSKNPNESLKTRGGGCEVTLATLGRNGRPGFLFEADESASVSRGLFFVGRVQGVKHLKCYLKIIYFYGDLMTETDSDTLIIGLTIS